MAATQRGGKPVESGPAFLLLCQVVDPAYGLDEPSQQIGLPVAATSVQYPKPQPTRSGHEVGEISPFGVPVMQAARLLDHRFPLGGQSL